MPSNYVIFRSHPCISMQKIRTVCLEEDDTDYFSFLIRNARCCREGENPCEVTVEGAVCWELMWSLLLCQTVRLLYTSCGTQERQVAVGDREMGPAPPLISLTSPSLLPHGLTRNASAKRVPLLSLRGQKQSCQSSQGREAATSSTCVFSVAC